jgi:hypothetical protein
MVNLNAEFLSLIGDFECKESYDYFLLGVEYAARISAEIARSQTGPERAIRAKFHLDDDPTHCYVCDRPQDDCACDDATRLEMAEREGINARRQL